MAFKELTKAQRDAVTKMFNHNINPYNVEFDSDESAIKFTSESTHRNWLYYAGFEYIKDGFDLHKTRNGFEAIYYADGSSRVGNVCDTLEEAEMNEEVTE
jgi:hypothetical protein